MNAKYNPIYFRMTLVATMLLSCLLALVVTTQAQSSNFTARPLADASPEEVGQAAIQLTEAKYPSRSGHPQVVLARSVTTGDLPALGLGTLDFASIETPPLMLVIVKGDFDTSKSRGLLPMEEKAKRHAQYIGYVFDLWAGVPSLTITSPQGGAFQKVLNDPSIPANALDAPLPAPKQPVQSAPKTLHYGETAPPVALPSEKNGR